MSKMAELKQLYQTHHKDGLEIIGVCFDYSIDNAKKAIESHALNWQQVLVPADEKLRQLWSEASGIEGLPLLRIMDGDGILRADGGPGELREQVTELLKVTPERSGEK